MADSDDIGILRARIEDLERRNADLLRQVQGQALPAPAMADVAALVEAGWNAARKSVYALCEDIEDSAQNALNAEITEHQAGFHRAEKLTAKRIRNAMGSFEAGDDDNARAALAALRGVKP